MWSVNVLAASNLTGELLTASQSVLAVLRQIGSVLGVAVFLSMLTNNLQGVEIKSLSHLPRAYTQIYQFWLSFLLLFLCFSLVFPSKKRYCQK
ncbi:hypothetical protein HU830_06140 [Lactobacillus sp. DCY120]|uniref:Uncharacterized protein n=1 Tax=Bombilactobacillus apium TaxID=2675299 RepID=A0A850QY24_9LACO|nr:hypothetical protein [Bombilactobacillus apium]NVY96734.1 hypothetical protein [Bombilactobacillus apium]